MLVLQCAYGRRKLSEIGVGPLSWPEAGQATEGLQYHLYSARDLDAKGGRCA